MNIYLIIMFIIVGIWGIILLIEAFELEKTKEESKIIDKLNLMIENADNNEKESEEK